MSTPNPVAVTVFTPLIKGFAWTPSTTDTTGAPPPPGETESGTTIGIRPDPTTAATPALQLAAQAFGPGNYQYLVVVPPTQNSEAPAAIQAALNKALIPGVNYIAALDQTDMLNGSPSTSAWTPEIGFVIPVPVPVVVKPATPTNFSAN